MQRVQTGTIRAPNGAPKRLLPDFFPSGKYQKTQRFVMRRPSASSKLSNLRILRQTPNGALLAFVANFFFEFSRNFTSRKFQKNPHFVIS